MTNMRAMIRTIFLSLAILGAGPGLAGMAAAQSTPKVSDEPIQIDADSLEVQQEKNLAIFKGNVDASQGVMKLKADELRVHYRAAEEQKDKQKSDVGGTILKIDALGQVRISTPDETASGDRGIYDLKLGTITLTGNVLLTRGENTLKGEKLVLDLNTSRSRIEGGPKGGRVKGIFVPPQKN